MKKLFGTDGIRGEAGCFPMTADFVLKVGMAVANLFSDGSQKRKIVIGKDTRRSGYMLENSLVAGITAAGVDAVLLGPLPTPGIAYMTKTLRADAGIVLSASHNPYYDNGIKIFDQHGFKLDDELELRIEKSLQEGISDAWMAKRDRLGKAKRIEGAMERYIEYCKSSFPRGMTLEGLKIVVDCANGAAYKVAPEVFRELRAEVIPIHCYPDGTNINKECGATNVNSLAQAVVASNADIGIALDGDADRLIVVDRFGQTVDGDQLIGIAAHYLKQRAALRGGAVVTTVMSNIGLERYLESIDLKLIRTNVGDRYVLDRMRFGGFNLGGEQSGHLIFLDYANTGDGIVSALQILAIMVQEGKNIDALASRVPRFPQVLINRTVSKKTPIEDLPRTTKRIAEIDALLGNSGRTLIRYSGTENKIRVMLEGDDQTQIQQWAEELAELIVTEIGA
ncbi:phosphoglucosamine mutase [Chrysiogenes arsenatis]|uniref:phosphoglucosamine mutase n=1 Tax=Chrysiogenes arsenatis TaxID=309797 RepID=UPI00040FA2B6|nr:phosphoglucosamine mutase [Chrysiogenes arsenatis]